MKLINSLSLYKLLIRFLEVKSDENFIPLMLRFNADRVGTSETIIEIKSLPDDIRIIPIEFKVTENVIGSVTVAKLQFNSCVFDPIVQAIPIVKKLLFWKTSFKCKFKFFVIVFFFNRKIHLKRCAITRLIYSIMATISRYLRVCRSLA